MLIRAIEELEVEATERVQMLEDKLKKSAVSGLEVSTCYGINYKNIFILYLQKHRKFNFKMLIR